jgi:hypothetical protein
MGVPQLTIECKGPFGLGLYRSEYLALSGQNLLALLPSTRFGAVLASSVICSSAEAGAIREAHDNNILFTLLPLHPPTVINGDFTFLPLPQGRTRPPGSYKYVEGALVVCQLSVGGSVQRGVESTRPVVSLRAFVGCPTVHPRDKTPNFKQLTQH